MADLPQVNAKQIELMKTIASGEKDKPVFMLNLNCYTPEAGYPNGMLYKNYMNVLDRLLDEVGGKIVWRTNVEGTVVGEQCIHEALGRPPWPWGRDATEAGKTTTRGARRTAWSD